MSVAASQRYPDVDPARCASCGEELEARQVAEPVRCIRCERRLLPAESKEPVVQDPDLELRLRFSARVSRVLVELLTAGAPSEGRRLLESLNAIEKRCECLLAFAPVVGPWLLQGSKHHSREEKQKLAALSLGLTLLIFAVTWMLMPSAADRLASLHQQMQLQMHVLGDVAEGYRREHRSYPDQATWKWFANQADGRFFDPWGRPYRYEPRADGVTLESLGRDGREGGSGKDTDVTVEHPRASAS